MKKKAGLFVLVIFVMCSAVNAAGRKGAVEQKIPRTEAGLEGMDLERFITLDPNIESPNFQYQIKMERKVSNFLREFCSVLSVEDAGDLFGEWRLADEKGSLVERESVFNGICTNFDSNISIFIEVEGDVNFHNSSSYSYIEKSDTGNLYITSRLHIIRMVKIIEEKMYVYVLDGDYWLLDPIHDGGKYAFIRTDDTVVRETSPF